MGMSIFLSISIGKLGQVYEFEVAVRAQRVEAVVLCTDWHNIYY